jgi:hypothetical protein
VDGLWLRWWPHMPHLLEADQPEPDALDGRVPGWFDESN